MRNGMKTRKVHYGKYGSQCAIISVTLVNLH